MSAVHWNPSCLEYRHIVLVDYVGEHPGDAGVHYGITAYGDRSGQFCTFGNTFFHIVRGTYEQRRNRASPYRLCQDNCRFLARRVGIDKRYRRHVDGCHSRFGHGVRIRNGKYIGAGNGKGRLLKGIWGSRKHYLLYYWIGHSAKQCADRVFLGQWWRFHCRAFLAPDISPES